MALEPSSIQRDQMLSHRKTKLTLAQFLVPKEYSAGQKFLTKSLQAVQREGGVRKFALQIDQLLTLGETPYLHLVVDVFPSCQTLLQAHESTRQIRQDSLVELYSILVEPDIWTARIVKWMGFLESAFTRWFDTAAIKDFDQFSDNLNSETDPDHKQVMEFWNGDLEQPFYMMNLNQFAPGGKKSYQQYSLRVTPNLISVGGYPVIFGDVLNIYVGDQNSTLDNQWHEFGLVYYPSRTSFLRMMTNIPKAAAQARRAGLNKAVLMPCTKAK